MSEHMTTSDEWAQALGGEFGGRVSGLTWECVCGANGVDGARGLYSHRRSQHVCTDRVSRLRHLSSRDRNQEEYP